MAKKIILQSQLKGGEKTKRGLKGVSSGLTSLAKKAALAGGAFFAARGIINGFKNSIDLSAKQELAEKKLEAALGKTSETLLNYASSLQKVTSFGDEATIEAMSMMAAFTKDEEALKKLTAVTLDYAAATGTDLNAASQLVGRTFGTSMNAMSRYGVEVEGAAGSTERLESLTGNLAKMFGGQAKAQTETMAGAITQAKNALGDMGEAFGDILAPIAVEGAKAMKAFAEKLEIAFDFIGKIDFKKTGSNLLKNGEALMTAFTDTVKAYFDFIPDFWKNAIKKILPILKTVLTKMLEGVKGFAGFVWEPIPISAGIMVLKIKRFFIEMTVHMTNKMREGVNNIKEEFNKLVDEWPKIADKLGIVKSELAKPIDMSKVTKSITGQITGLQKDLEATGMADFIKNLMPGEGDIQTSEEFTNRLAEIFQAYADNIIAVEENLTPVIVDNEDKKTEAIDKTGEASKKTTEETKKMTIESAISSGQSAQSWQGAIRGIIKSYAAQSIAGQIKEVFSKVPPPFSFMIAATAAAAASQLFDSLIPAFAQGGNFVTSGPQMIMVGDNPSGRERVQISPLGGDPNISGPQGGITLNISAPLIDETVIDSIIPAIQKAQRLNLA